MATSTPFISRPFRERVSDALRRRLRPNTALTAEVLAHAVDLSVATIQNLLAGEHEPSGRSIDKLVGFFKDQFINEIWGCHHIVCFHKNDPAKADALRRRAEIDAELQAMENG